MSATIPLPTALATPVRVLGLEESRPERILVVDDDSDIRNLLVRLLRSGGYDVSDAPDGHEALRRLTEAPVHALPDLLLMDVTMPGMDGVATCVALQALGLGSHTPPVIFLSAL
ncbi:MAG TPA: response regulator, partial [Chloroflexota bacterium]|nr:response regulator [Chloroflexota bacterium]